VYQPKKLGRAGQGYPRSERKRQLVAALLDCRNVNSDSTCWFSSGQMAKLVGLKNTANFRALLAEMYSEGHMLCQSATHRPNQFKFIWSLAGNTPYSEMYSDLRESKS